VIGFSGLDPRTARAPGAENASQESASFFPSRVFYPLHSTDAMAVGLNVALRVFGSGAGIWSKTKSVVSPTGEITIRSRHADTGKITASRYRLTARGNAQQRHDTE
jgi:hypothetical protein